ncbi:MAG: immunoglobulin domain-containing protein [Limisphaerales bacterium]
MTKLSWPHRCWREWSKIINAFSAVISLVVVMMFARPVCAAERQVVHIHMPAAAAHLQPLGPMGSSQPLNLAIGLPLRNQETLNNLLEQIYDPASPNYHHFLTPEQFTAQFGPSEQDYQAVIAFAKANGLTVMAENSNRLLVDVSGSVADIERVLHVRMQVYQHPTENRTFYAPDVEPSLDLAVPILGISGLNNYSLPRPHYVVKPLVQGQAVAPNAGSGPGGTYMGKDFRAAYAPDTMLDGSGQVVGLLQFDGYTASDITYYESQAGLPSVTLSNVLIDGASGLPSGSGGEVEVSLDIEMVISMATNVSQVIVYEAPNPSPFVDILNRMATDNLAKQLSCSWYVPNGTAEPAAEQIWQEMAAQGQSFFNASGDNDAYTGLIDFPGDSTNITQVGGTTLTTSGAGGAWASETVWNWGNGIGSGGGISTQYPIPYWQTNINMTANQGSTTMRNTPDVALTADNVYVRADGNNYDVGGTSCAAPLWAGFAALVNQQAAATGEPAVGFINPAIDAIGSGPNYTTCFHDITTGNNTSGSSPTRFYAVTGYDLCTGWGTPNGQKLINALANPEALQITPITGFTSMGGVGGPFTVTAQSFSLTNVGTNSLTWTLSNTSLWLNASSSGGALARGGPATNVMISLNSVASNLLVGTYQATVWFTNLNDQVGQGRQFTLAVLSPPAITQQPTNQAVLDGATATFSVEVTGGLPLYYQWQYNSNNLTDGGNISGSTTTNLTINNASLANVGYYDLIVSNAAGVVVSTNALLTIVPSPPVIIQQPTDETVVVKGTAQFTVAALGTKPFSYQWSFNETNIADGTNATLVLTNVQFDQAGAYAVVITNIYGSTLSSNANLTVTPCDPAPSGLVSWWKAEGNALDEVGTNNGTLVGNATYGPGEVGQGFVFDGNGSGVSIANATNLQLQDLTIEAWIQRSSSSVVSYGSGGNGVIFGYGTGGYLFFMNSAGSLIFGQLGNPAYVTGPAITDTSWHHVAVTKVGSVIVFYLDGVAYATPAFSVTFTFTTSVGIGYRPDNGDNGFLGTIDEMSIYNRVLTSTEIQDIYLAGSGGKCFTPEPPVITTQPTNQTVVAGQTATFSVSASGTQPLSYQWTFDTTNIAAGTNATLILTDVQSNQAGVYAVMVSNLVDSVLSSNATLTDLVPPTIITQPTNQTVYVGGTASFGVTASGTPPLNYQWNFNQTNIANATNTTLVLTNAQLNQAGNYAVLVTNLVNSVLSSNAVLTVNPPPTLGVTTSGGFALIFWPVSMQGFVLETSSSLSLANWVPVPNPPIQIGNEYLESIQMTGTNQFFRLQLGE